MSDGRLDEDASEKFMEIALFDVPSRAADGAPGAVEFTEAFLYLNRRLEREKETCCGCRTVSGIYSRTRSGLVLLNFYEMIRKLI